MDFRSQDLAEQLTLLDSQLFHKIQVGSCLTLTCPCLTHLCLTCVSIVQLPEVLLWSKEQNEEKTPNLTEFTQHFNNVSFW